MRVVLPPHRLPFLRLAVGAAALAVTASCSAAPAPPQAAPAPAAAATAAPDAGHGAGHGGAGHGADGAGAVGLYAVQSGPLGVVTTDADGHIVYRHDADTPTSSACTGACAQVWLPIVVPPGAEPELLGVDPGDVGRLERPEGSQLTLAGWPLYHRADDDGGLTDAGEHGADGVWFAITPDGERATAP